MKSFRFKRTQRKYKTPYKIGNWRAYEAGLRQRGSVTVWITADAKKAWCHRGRRKPGGKRVLCLLQTPSPLTGLNLRLSQSTMAG